MWRRGKVGDSIKNLPIPINGAHDLRYHPNARGFDEFIGFLNGGMDYWNWVLDYNGKPVASDGRYLTDVFSEEAKNYIKHNKDNKFFLYLAYNAPHNPLQAPKELINKYEKQGKLTKEVSTIYAMIEKMDSGIGDILRTLKQEGIERDTIVIFTSDNGPLLDGNRERYNGPFRGQKGNSLEGGIRVPAVAQWLGVIPDGIKTNEFVHFVDWFPTLKNLTGEKVSENITLDGENVISVLMGKNRKNHRLWYWQHNRYTPLSHCNAAIRDGKWKLYWPIIKGSCKKEYDIDKLPYQRGLTEHHKIMEIDTSLPQREFAETVKSQLFNLEKDSFERHDLSQKYSDRVKQMT
ncbi:MAG: sulfatase-like hydrolase/transferase, partial [bacterium]